MDELLTEAKECLIRVTGRILIEKLRGFLSATFRKEVNLFFNKIFSIIDYFVEKVSEKKKKKKKKIGQLNRTFKSCTDVSRGKY